MAGVALFDLDNTLVDRDAFFAMWATELVASVGGGPEDLAWTVTTDAAGLTPREGLLRACRERWQLAEPVEDLVDRYQRAQADFYRPDPDVVEPLQELRAAGWHIAVVTNGPAAQRRKVDRSGLQDLIDVVCISEEVGSAKPEAGIFLHALRELGTDDPRQAVMVGDNPEADIGGASELGCTTIWMARGRRWPELPFAPDHTVDDVRTACSVILTRGD